MKTNQILARAIIVSLAIANLHSHSLVAQDDALKGALERAQKVLEGSGVDREALEQDRQLIVSTAPRLAREGVRATDIPEVAAGAWLCLRYRRELDLPNSIRERNRLFGDADTDTRKSLFLGAGAALGKLTITSVPKGADIEVTGISWDTTTNTSKFVDEGRQSVTVIIEGYEPMTKVVDVKKRMETAAEFKLVKKQQK